jgi:hypothetical protein
MKANGRLIKDTVAAVTSLAMVTRLLASMLRGNHMVLDNTGGKMNQRM